MAGGVREDPPRAGLDAATSSVSAALAHLPADVPDQILNPHMTLQSSKQSPAIL